VSDDSQVNRQGGGQNKIYDGPMVNGDNQKDVSKTVVVCDNKCEQNCDSIQ